VPNNAYLKGRKHEWKVQELLESEGYLTFRTAGSHTPVDVLAFWTVAASHDPTYSVWVQVKSASPISNSDWNILFETAEKCGAVPVLAICLPREPISFMQLLGTRAKNSYVKPWTEWSP
jgi:Holliday junction resolvase